jgi:hypothetical protein
MVGVKVEGQDARGLGCMNLRYVLYMKMLGGSGIAIVVVIQEN